MDIERFREICLSKKGVTEGFPFGPDVLVFKVMGKMFALSALDRPPHKVNLKCDPERAIELREEWDGSISPGYHMNKKHWNTVQIEALPDELLLDLTEHSYHLIVDSLPKKTKAQWEAL